MAKTVAPPIEVKKQKQCKAGYACGYTCIARGKRCQQKLGHSAGKIAEDFTSLLLAQMPLQAKLPATWGNSEVKAYSYSGKTAKGIPVAVNITPRGKIHDIAMTVSNQTNKNKFLRPKERLQAGLLNAKLIREAIGNLPDGSVMSMTLPSKPDGLEQSRQKAWQNAGFSVNHRDGKAYAVKVGSKLYPVSPEQLAKFQ